MIQLQGKERTHKHHNIHTYYSQYSLGENPGRPVREKRPLKIGKTIYWVSKHGMCGKKILQPIKNAALVCKGGICNDILSSERNGNFILKCPKKGG